MKITHYLYNAFLVDAGDASVVTKPDQNPWKLALRRLLPIEDWPAGPHIAITHGDPDHHWHSDRAACV